MFKNTGHMQKIERKKASIQEAAKKAQASKQQRMNKKLGKAVQHAREQEKHAQKRAAVASIEQFKKRRKEGGLRSTDAEKEFDAQVASRRTMGKDSKSAKRKAKDAKHGFGGKKRGLKRNDAASSRDDSQFSHSKMKAPFAKGVSKNRPGKANRAKSNQAKIRAAANAGNRK